MSGSTVAVRGPSRRRLVARTVAVPVVILALVLFAALFHRVLSTHDPNATSAIRYAGPSADHWFGTDELGRDLYSRVLAGARLTFLIALPASVFAMTLGTAWGMIAGYRGGIVDGVLMRTADAAMAIPQILTALILVNGVGSSVQGLGFAIGVVLVPFVARMARSATLAEVNAEYMIAAVATGARPLRLIRSELLPNVMPTLLVQSTIVVANAILLEATLSFLGVGIQPPRAPWGSLLQQGYLNVYRSVTYALFPGGAIFLTVWMLTLLGDRLERRVITGGGSA